MPPVTYAVDQALMCLPYEEWIALPDAAEQLRARGLSCDLANIVRTGRRRGVLRTRKSDGADFVMRTHDAPRRRAAVSA
ncbi:hypothetical protein [Streptomyces subrutilus]|uniref:Uncharacterized protein n=1 Tax=Streptomyces subrutilus TaxID=36818 RepID=A0A1E5NY02_9ACTN|nr:hypothetical protein [Streptomyces subrutilus]OEJ21017.1 hypothetical protein BGK67_34540 [Streptomyces subrutilus]